jgi:hypothetical protein
VASRKPPTDKNPKGKPTPFAHDPFREHPLDISPEDYEALDGRNFLSTQLIDYIIQRAMPTDLPDHILIGSSSAQRFFQMMNDMKVDSTNPRDAKTAKTRAQAGQRPLLDIDKRYVSNLPTTAQWLRLCIVWFGYPTALGGRSNSSR